MLIWLTLVVVFMDQVSKTIVLHTLRINESVVVLDNFFNLVHVRNRGMAFGIMNQPGLDFAPYLLMGTSVAVIVMILIWQVTLKQKTWLLKVSVSLILAGAAGNLIDRIRFREVVDFLDFYIGSWHWPAFNIADSAITIGAFLLAVNLVFERPSGSSHK